MPPPLEERLAADTVVGGAEAGGCVEVVVEVVCGEPWGASSAGTEVLGHGPAVFVGTGAAVVLEARGTEDTVAGD